jgi:alpha-D-xyloside xylohydrolase
MKKKNKAILILAAWGCTLLPALALWDLADRGDAPTAIPVTSVQANADGLTLSMNPGTLQLQVFDPKIVRVAYTRSGTIPSAPADSLAVLASSISTGWSWTQTSSNVTLNAGSVEARVDKSSGAVSFHDSSSGSLLFQEPETGGRSMTATTIAGGSTWICRQEFRLNAGQALYGLGQHNTGALDYRGNIIEMVQNNPTESAVPMLFSSGGFGVLMDNPALSLVDTTGGTSEIVPSTAMIDKNGTAGRLSVEYYEGDDFNTFKSSGTDTSINYDWGSGNGPAGLPADHFSIRWEGSIKATEGSGMYTLQVTSDDGVRLWVDGTLLIDSWVLRAPTTDSVNLNWTSNSVHTVKIEYYEWQYGAVMKFAWVPPGEKQFSWIAEAGKAVDYYFIQGPEPDDVVAGYRKLTGGVPMFSKWAWGFWQSKERYQNQQELIDVVNRYRTDGVPLDGIVQDWHWWPDLDDSTTPPSHGWGSHEFDASRFSNFPSAVSTIHAAHARVLISVWPWFQRTSGGTLIPNGKALDDIGAILPFPGNTWAGNMSWYDPYGQAARELYWQQVSNGVFSTGIDGFWLDSTEPVAGGDEGRIREYNTLGGPGYEVANAYPLMQSAAVYEGQRASTSDKRVFILTRSAYAGQQRNGSVVWSGDIDAEWSVFRKQIPAGLNFSISGIPYWNTDIGGFWINRAGFSGPGSAPYDELFTRWYQFGAFCPMFRVHGSDYAKEYWRFPAATQTILKNYDRLRYHLIPYIYSVSHMVTADNYTMMRPLVMDFRNDLDALTISDQYLFGPALMPCPVVESNATSRSVYLPSGAIWYDFWTGNTQTGGQTVVASAPIEKMPLYVRAGSILPYGPEIQYATATNDPTELRVYPGADGTFTLYEDENDGYDYENGVSSAIHFSWDESEQTLTIAQREGTFPGMLENRTFKIVWVTPNHGTGVPNESTPDKTITYDGAAIKIHRFGDSSSLYTDWISAHPAVGNATNRLDDPDGDHFNNLAEYATGGDPSDPTSTGNPIFFSVDATNFGCIFSERNDKSDRELEYIFEVRTNLLSGTWQTGSVYRIGIHALDDEFNQITNHILFGNGSQEEEVIRLRVKSQ